MLTLEKSHDAPPNKNVKKKCSEIERSWKIVRFYYMTFFCSFYWSWWDTQRHKHTHTHSTLFLTRRPFPGLSNRRLLFSAEVTQNSCSSRLQLSCGDGQVKRSHGPSRPVREQTNKQIVQCEKHRRKDFVRMGTTCLSSWSAIGWF